MKFLYTLLIILSGISIGRCLWNDLISSTPTKNALFFHSDIFYGSKDTESIEELSQSSLYYIKTDSHCHFPKQSTNNEDIQLTIIDIEDEDLSIGKYFKKKNKCPFKRCKISHLNNESIAEFIPRYLLSTSFLL